eukprot:5345765-Pyramimonas_sp.AAC.1
MVRTSASHDLITNARVQLGSAGMSQPVHCCHRNIRPVNLHASMAYRRAPRGMRKVRRALQATTMNVEISACDTRRGLWPGAR